MFTKGPPERSCFFFFNACCWSRIHFGLNSSMKLTGNANESLQQLSLQRCGFSVLFFFVFFFFQFCIQAADASEFSSFFCSTCGPTASKGKYSQHLAVTPACLHILFASHLCTVDDLIRPVHQSLSQFGCKAHSDGAKHILMQRCSALVSNMSPHCSHHAEMWGQQRVARQWKHKSKKSQQNHTRMMIYILFFIS